MPAVTKNTTSVGFALEANLLAHCRVVTPSLAHVARNRNPEVGWGVPRKVGQGLVEIGAEEEGHDIDTQ